MSSRPWVRLYRREEGSFAQLSLYARALAAELLKLTDDEGIIRIGAKAPHEAIAFALGANRSDRRLLKGHLEELFRDGYLVHEEDRIRIPGFSKFQADPQKTTVSSNQLESHEEATVEPPQGNEAATTEPREIHEATAMEPRSDHDGAAIDPRRSHEATTMEPRRSHDGATKSELTMRNHTRALREDKIREDKRREEPIRLSDVAPQITHQDPSVIIAESYRAGYRERFGVVAPRLHFSDGRVSELVRLAKEQAELEGADVRTIIDRFFTRFWSSESAARLRHQPGSMQALFSELMAKRSPAATRGPAPARDHSEFETTTDEELKEMFGC